MQAYVVGEDGKGMLQAYSAPVRGSGKALIQVLRAGICNTDLEILRGYMSFKGVLGHEFVGKVLDVDAGDDIKVGQRVVGEINIPCNTCDICKQGGVIRRNHCSNRTVVGILNKDGTYATHMILPVTNLYPVPDNITDDQAAFAEPLAAAFRIVEQGLIKSTDKVALLGDGKLGLLIASVINTQEKGVFMVFGRHKEKMALVPPGVETCFSSVASKMKYDSYFDVVIDATGSPSGLDQAICMTKPLGTLVLKTTCAKNAEINESLVVVKEIQIIGSRCGNFPMALEALSKKSIDVDKLISKVYPLGDVEKALEHAATKGTLKIQLNMSSN